MKEEKKRRERTEGFSMSFLASLSKAMRAFSLSTTTPSTKTPFISTAYPQMTAPIPGERDKLRVEVKGLP